MSKKSQRQGVPLGATPKQLTCDDILEYIRDELNARGDDLLLSTSEVSLRPLKDRFPPQARVTARIRSCVQGGFIRRTTGGGPSLLVALNPAGVQRLRERGGCLAFTDRWWASA